MSETDLVLLLVGAVVAALVLTGIVRKATLRRSILDYPSARSSHVRPTPRGGGLAICAVVLLFLLVASTRGHIDGVTALALGGGGLAIGIVGWLDDLKNLPAMYRLAVHLLAAVWAIVLLGGLPSVAVGESAVYLGVLGAPLAILGLVWSTNLFNFMDGTDGIAAVEAVCVAGAAGLLLLSRDAAPLASLALVAAGACLGFLFYNWEPAKIFMGDVGSGFLGFLLAGMALVSENSEQLPLLVWAILAAVFIVDATITFGRRLRHGHWRVAHRSHAYQRLVQAGWSHRKVAVAVGVLNAGLALLAVAAAVNPQMLLPSVAVAFGSVTALYIWVETVVPFTPPPAT